MQMKSQKHWMLLTNAQSLFYKIDELRALITITKPVFVCVTETWFTPDIDNEVVQIYDYQLFRSDRRDNPSDMRRGGGTIIYASSVISPFNVTLPSDFQKPFGFEYSILGFTESELCFLMCVYVPPNLNAEAFSAIKTYIVDLFDYLLCLSPNANIYLCGDFNRYNFEFMSNLFDLINVVDFPTFGDNTLDKFFCDVNSSDLFSASSAPPLGSANNLHKVVFISKNLTVSLKNNLFQKVYDLRKSNVDAFCKRMASIDWSVIFDFSSVQESVDYFYNKFEEASSSIPVSFVKFGPKTKPWITPVLLDLINKRWSAYRNKNFPLFLHYKLKVKKELKRSKKIWSEKMCSSAKGVWSVVNDIRNKNEHDSASKIASMYPSIDTATESLNRIFSSFFVNSLPVPLYQTAHRERISLCDQNFVLTLLENLRTDKACGSDGMSARLLKAAANSICFPICHIFNTSFVTSCIPDLWKVADVCPIPKCMPVNENQLRPISLLPILAKLYEKSVLKRYRKSLLQCFDKSQFSYRPFSSTTCALLNIQDSVLRLLDNYEVAGVYIVTFDMSHAFDSVPHHLLLSCLSDFDLPDRELFLNWVNNYLTNRKQRVRLFNNVSSVSSVSSGIPQGSVLGPYFFAIFMSTYQPFLNDTCIAKYADDVTLVVPVYKCNLNNMSRVTSEIDFFHSWCDDHGMSVNVHKSKCMSVSFGKNTLSTVPNLQNVMSLKILGVFFNRKLTWSDHLVYISGKLSRRLYVLRILKPLLSHDQLVSVFYAIIRSLYEYACPVFLNPGVAFDTKIMSLCKRAFHIIHGRDCSHCDNCDLMNVQSRRQLLSLRLFTAAVENREHSLHSIVPQRFNRPSGNRLRLPHVRCHRRLKAFVISCALLYNSS